MYKVGDEVLFTFLGEMYKGVLLNKIDKVKWRIQSDSGKIFPFIYNKPPVKKKGVKYEEPLGIIIKKV